MYTFYIPCLMGVEGLVADELRFGGFDGVNAQNGKVYFTGDETACARANINIRCGERVLLQAASFHARTFDELFDNTKQYPWENIIDRTDAFPVKGYSTGSRLASEPACQKIIKKAIVSRLEQVYGVSWFPEEGVKKQIQFSISKDMCEICVDTSGEPLYKRGYKLLQNDATIRETLAAAMVKLSRYRGRDEFFDPLCGSGTIAIEAAMSALSIAPGAYRRFAAEAYDDRFKVAFRQEFDAARANEKTADITIFASDNDPRAIAMTKENAEKARVLKHINITCADVADVKYADKGTLITNPPYGVRMLDTQNARALIKTFGEVMRDYPGLKKYIISSDESFEQFFGVPAQKKRKLYNGMMKCNLHMYY